MFDYESQALRLEHRDRGQTPEHVKLRRMRDERVKSRLFVATVSFVLVAVAGLVGWWFLPQWSLRTVAGCTVLAFG